MATTAPRIFDRQLLGVRRARAASSPEPVSFLHEEVAGRIVERLDELRREFAVVLELGTRDHALGRMLKGRPGLGQLVSCDASIEWLQRENPAQPVVCDWDVLPFGADSFDAVVSGMAFHWVNDLPGLLAQIRSCLKPDGIMLAAFPGGESLRELRSSLLQAEIEVRGGASPRVSPFVDLRDAAALLQRAGFALPVADMDRVSVSYPDPWKLISDLRAMGEASALASRAAPLRREVLARAVQLYTDGHADAAGRVPATFDIVFLAGWKPHESQQRPLQPGSAAHRLSDALNAGPP
jgi:SAM-dependent methyltransferase